MGAYVLQLTVTHVLNTVHIHTAVFVTTVPNLGIWREERREGGIGKGRERGNERRRRRRERKERALR